MLLADIVDPELLAARIEAGYVREQRHPSLPLAILNYTAACQSDRAWDDVTRTCRGLIYSVESGEVVARPFPKFHNYGEHDEGSLDMEAPVRVFNKADGSLGILYPAGDGWAVATRGSFMSEQALHATQVLRARYGNFMPDPALTYLFEIVYAANRIVVDYGDTDDLILLDILVTETGFPALDYAWSDCAMPWIEEIDAATLADALRLPPRPNAEGVVVVYQGTWERVKIKQDDYVALHRILTGTNARNVWEVAAVQACAILIAEPKHWGSYLGIDPARADEVLALGGDWLENVPDEFHGWVRDVTDTARGQVNESFSEMTGLAVLAADHSGRERFEYVSEHAGAFQREVMRLAAAVTDGERERALAELRLRAWRAACPAPTAPFARSEDVA